MIIHYAVQIRYRQTKGSERTLIKVERLFSYEVLHFLLFISMKVKGFSNPMLFYNAKLI